MLQKAVICVALAAVLSAVVMAEDPQACQDIVGQKIINGSELVGFWYEIARAPSANTACMMSKFELANNNTQMNVTINYASSSSSVLMDKHETGFFNVTNIGDKNAFTMNFHDKNMTYKVLSTDNLHYLSVCGYTSSNVSTSYGAVLVKDKDHFNKTLLNEVITNTSHVLLNFNNNTIVNITQTGCRANSASTSVPYMTSMFALLLLVAKFLN